ncbi:MAG: EVE domain-containing protein [Anaerolineae bacterium]|nr:MAG: EVE domain-containing protein [Anaerolineae bacterium]
MQYWTHLYTWQTWQEFLNAGGDVTGFPERRWATVQQMQPGDILLVYVIGLSRYVAIMEVAGEPYKGYKPIWSERVYAARVPVRVRLALLPEYGIPVTDLRDELSYFQQLKDPRAWTIHFRSAPVQETPQDAEVIIAALENASEDPIFRELDPDKLDGSPTLYESDSGVVTVPDEEETLEDEDVSITHDEIQWLLLDTGSKMGLDVWVARNDRHREFEGQYFQSIPRLLDKLPRQFDAATSRTIELIDVLWLRENAIIAAFEIEHTSAVYSGLLRMADLVSMHPNINIRLYIVAPDERRYKVFSEINRPAFTHLKPPLNKICQFIPYSTLKSKVTHVQDVLSYLQPEFINDIAENFEAKQ